MDFLALAVLCFFVAGGLFWEAIRKDTIPEAKPYYIDTSNWGGKIFARNELRQDPPPDAKI